MSYPVDGVPLTRALSAMTRSPVCSGVVLAAPTLLPVPDRSEFRVTSPVVERIAETGWVPDGVGVVLVADVTVGAAADAPPACVVVITGRKEETWSPTTVQNLPFYTSLPLTADFQFFCISFPLSLNIRMSWKFVSPNKVLKDFTNRLHFHSISPVYGHHDKLNAS